MINKGVIQDGNMEVKTCIYREDSFSLVKISEELMGTHILNHAINNGVLNLNALYKHFIDDNFEHNTDVQDHQIEEVTLENGSLLLSISSLDEHKKILRSHTIEITPHM